MDAIQVAVVNWTDLGESDVLGGIAALQRQVDADFGPTGRIEARLVPWSGREPNPDVWGLVLLDWRSHPGSPGRQALDHYGHHTSGGHPLARVFLDQLLPGQQWTHLASHELLEMLVDPHRSAAVYRDGGGDPFRVYARRVCDPCAGYSYGYEVNGCAVSDFVHPSWFGGRGSRKDERGRIGRPFEVLPDGWIGVIDPASWTWRALHSDGSTQPRPEERPEGTLGLGFSPVRKPGWGP
jgi:hypothetical protein